MCHVSLHFAVLNLARSETAPESIGLMQARGQSALPCSREELRYFRFVLDLPDLAP